MSYDQPKMSTPVGKTYKVDEYIKQKLYKRMASHGAAKKLSASKTAKGLTKMGEDGDLENVPVNNFDYYSYHQVYQILRGKALKYGGIKEFHSAGPSNLEDWYEAVKRNGYKPTDMWDEPSEVEILFNDGHVMLISEAAYPPRMGVVHRVKGGWGS